MAKVKPSIIEYTGTVGREIHYTRFGRTYSRQLPAEYNDRKSEAQLRQRALFKARQQTSALYGIILQRGLTKEAHAHGMTEANYFSRLNKEQFVYDNGIVHINYPALIVASGPLPEVYISRCHANGLQVEIDFRPNLDADKARPDDVVHFYAVSPLAEICMLMTSVSRQDGHTAFVLPDVSDEMATEYISESMKKRSKKTDALTHSHTHTLIFYLYAIVEAASTASTPTLSAAEKQQNKKHRNINRRVSRSVFVGSVKTSGK